MDRLMADYTFEITSTDLPQVRDALTAIAPGTRVNVTALTRESVGDRLGTISSLVDLGLRPVAHIAARGVSSATHLSSLLADLQRAGASEEVFLIGGDSAAPAGPYRDSLDLIRSGILPEFGVRRVGVAFYPEGHPHIADEVLELDFANKLRALNDQDVSAYATSQFCFDAQAVCRSVASILANPTLSGARIGVPGPATVTRLMRFAARFGVKSSAGIVRKYGLSLTNLMSTAKPTKFIDDLAQNLPVTEVPITLHFYPFGAVADTITWVDDLTKERS